ncbi:MAG: hypothetical protein GX869_07590 [Candidatus Cloacimonetes bacterium]|nr:hypothetical protein [Candidatus Cloacimonadota bacterium]
MFKKLKQIPYKPERNVFLRAKYVSNRILELPNGVKVQANIEGKINDEVDIFLTVMPNSSLNIFPIAIVLGNRTERTESRYYLYENSRFFGNATGILKTGLNDHTQKLNITGQKLNVTGEPKINCSAVEIPNGVRTDFTFQDPELNIMTSFKQYSSRIYLNGLRQGLNSDYVEIFEIGKIMFFVPPSVDDIIYGDFNIAWEK